MIIHKELIIYTVFPDRLRWCYTVYGTVKQLLQYRRNDLGFESR